MRTSYKIYFICIFLLINVVPVSAEFYEYIDENGIIHYTNNLTTIPPEYRSRLTQYPETKGVLAEKNVLAPDEQLSTAPSQAAAETEEPSENIDMNESEPDVMEAEQFDPEPGISPEEEATTDTSAKTDAESLALSKLRKKRNTLINKKNELNKNLEDLINEKKQIENSKNTTEDINIQKYNQNVKALNEKIKQYKKDDEALRVEIETFNESINAHRPNK